MLNTPSLIKLFDRMTDGVLIVDAKWNIAYANSLARGYLSIPESAEKISEDLIPKLSQQFILSRDLADISEANDWSVAFEADNLPESTYDLTLSLYMSRPTEEGLRFLLMRDVTSEKREETCKRSFLSLISHKLTTPLAVIRAHLENMAEAITGPVNEKQAESLTKSLKKVGQLEEIVKKLISYTSLQAEGRKGTVESVDAIAFTRDICNKFAATSRGKQVEFQFGAAEAAFKIEICQNMFATVIENILDNSVKFSHRDNVRIIVSGRKETGTGEFVLSISDDGPGIPPTIKQHIFSAFVQHEKDFTGNVEGLGLGLAAVHHMMATLGGRVSIESEHERGTTVNLFFPAAEE